MFDPWAHPSEMMFLGLSAATLVQYARYADRARLEVALAFAALVPIIVQELVFPQPMPRDPLWDAVANLAFLWHPWLLVRIVGHFRETPLWIRRASTAGLVVSSATAILFLSSPPWTVALRFSYAVLAMGYVVSALIAGAFRTGGVTRRRLQSISLGFALLLLALVIFSLMEIRPEWRPPLDPVAVFLSFAASLALFAGLTPPRRLRRAWQLPEVHAFLQEDRNRPIETRAASSVSGLPHAAIRVTGAVSAAVALERPGSEALVIREAAGPAALAALAIDRDGPLAAGLRGGQGLLLKATDLDDASQRVAESVEAQFVLSVPVATPERARGVLVILLRKEPLFPADDVELASVLGAHAAFLLEHERVLEEARESSAYARALLEASLDPFIVMDREGRVTDVNSATEELLGRPRAEIAGCELAGFVSEPDAARRAVAEALGRQAVRDVALTVPRPAGPPCEVLFNARTFHAAGGRIDGVFAAARDITKLRALERDAAAQRETAYRRERLAALGTLVAGVAHEINNPLAYLQSNIELAALDVSSLEAGDEGVDLGATRRALDVALEGVHRIAGISRNLRVVGKGGSPVRAPLDVNEVLASVQRLVGNRLPPRAEIRFEPSPAPLMVWASAQDLHRVLLNLVQNGLDAVTATGGGRVQVRCGLRDGEVEMAVEDTGKGIAPEVLPKLFTPFFTTKPGNEGTGLGLSIVHSLVQEHQGRILVESAPGKGAKFRVRLPLALAAPAAPA